MAAQFPQDQHEKITNALLQSGAVVFTATDWPHPSRQPLQGNTTAMYVTGNGHDELSPISDKLREGADAALLVELRQMPFEVYGRMTDRYGVEWFFRGATANRNRGSSKVTFSAT